MRPAAWCRRSSRLRFRNRHELLVGGDGERERDTVLAVDRRVLEQQVQQLAALRFGQAVETGAGAARPRHDLLHRHAPVSLRRRARLVLIQPRSQPFQPLADEAPLVVELALADLPRHVEPDGAVLLQLHARQLALGARDLLGDSAVLVRVQRRQPGRDQVRVLQHAPDLAPDQLLEPLGADERVLATAQAVGRPHPVAAVVAARRLEPVRVRLAAAPGALAADHAGAHQHPALAAAHEVLEQVEGLRVARRAGQPPLAQHPRPFPRPLVHERREGHPIQRSRGWAWTLVPASVAVWRALPYHQVPR